MPITTTPPIAGEVRHTPPVCIAAVAQPRPTVSWRVLAWLGDRFALSLIYLVSVLWWVFVIVVLVWSYAHPLFKPPRSAAGVTTSN